MSRLLIPAGQSLAQIAQQLGVAVDTLAQHTDIHDVDEMMVDAITIDVPDGFLKDADRNRRCQYPRVPHLETLPGITASVALGIEYRRTVVAGDQGLLPITGKELEALREADRSFGRLEPDSNDLAKTLYVQLTRSPKAATRAHAYAAASVCCAMGHQWFGDDPKKCQPQALSYAKAALMADPKLPLGQRAMGMALRITPLHHHLIEARAAAERCIDADANHFGGWLLLTEILLDQNDTTSAEKTIEVARRFAPENPTVICVQCDVWLATSQRHYCAPLLGKAKKKVPTFLNTHVMDDAIGDVEHSEDLMQRIEKTTDLHQRYLRLMYARLRGRNTL